MMDTFADKIASLTYERFSKLPKKGKPQNKKEWTLLSSVVMSNCHSSEETKFKVIAIATGTKCLGQSFLSSKGDMVSDSHAEVLARRAFIRYIFYHVSLVLNGQKSTILQLSEKGICEVKSGVQFHFFTSHPPCGDASIFPKIDEVISTPLTLSQAFKRNVDEPLENVPKKCKSDSIVSDNISSSLNNQLSSNENFTNYEANFEDIKTTDIFRTGAKCVQGEAQDPKGEGIDFHITGVLRTKPGRGDPTLCMSCSDKMAVWNICGLQGALNSHFLSEPIYWTSIVIGMEGSTVSKCALNRAIVDRTSEVINLPTGYRRAFPSIYHSNLQFEYSKENTEKLSSKIVPCPAAIIWCDIPEPNFDVCVNGKRQGITKRNLDKPSSWVNICRRKLFEEFNSIVSLTPKEKLSDELRNTLQLNGAYSDFKKAAVSYQQAKKAVLKIFGGWTQKPEYLQKFHIDQRK